jgi:phage terminase large subunit GpA-like protein
VVLADEIDRYPASAGIEGDPLALSHKRANNFWNRRKLSGSTPTVAGISRIEAAWELSDKRRFYVPCPGCNLHQVLTWDQVGGKRMKPASICIRPPITSAPNAAIPGTTSSDGPRSSRESGARLRRSTASPGFHIWEAYSPWVKLAETVKGFLDAKDHPEALKVWTNTTLGETWAERGEAPDWQRLYERRRQELRLGDVPEWVGVLTAGADVQRNRIEVDVWGWGDGMQSALIDHQVFHGDPAAEAVWAELDEYLGARVAGGRKATPAYRAHGDRYRRRLLDNQRLFVGSTPPAHGHGGKGDRPL